MNQTLQTAELQKANALSQGKFWNRALIVSALLGFSADLLGISLCAVSYPGILPCSDTLNFAGTWLIAGGLPFIFFAAHCLDRIDFDRKHTPNQ